MAADMLTNLVRELDDLSVLHTRNTQNGLVGVACVNPLHKKISPPGRVKKMYRFSRQFMKLPPPPPNGGLKKCFIDFLGNSWKFPNFLIP